MPDGLGATPEEITQYEQTFKAPLLTGVTGKFRLFYAH
jgi:hypothetical protein